LSIEKLDNKAFTKTLHVEGLTKFFSWGSVAMQVSGRFRRFTYFPKDLEDLPIFLENKKPPL